MKSLHRQKGAELVEFAISSSLLFILLFGIIEFSVALFDKSTLTNASREGARHGILFRPGERALAGGSAQCPETVSSENDAIRDAVCRYAEDYLISLGGAAVMSIDIARSDRNTNTYFDAGDELTVTVNYPYQFLLLPEFVGTLGGILNLSSTIVMRAE
ncbi:TadE/TadG family type IV pilus assembly protein [Modicisalibacter xianhensis]|uniref:Flp pilus assembly protein TadG n=1 Tax=Modicisalibacter xianhensis TaxID=442341 RepID=A0A1I2ZMM8_9GAMM|nr:TadE/TadG family type IV pilus assembly protein [Halomonas xianhensis]SFH39004.1 Flp pilus assembly protein TadG [Halomonas xianhensis]